MVPLKDKVQILIFSLLFSTVSVAATNDPIEIAADTIDIQDANSTSTYIGNAKLTQGDDYIYAEKIIIRHPDQEIESIKIIGKKNKPARIKITLKDGKIIKGKSDSIFYDVNTEILELEGRVRLEQDKNVVIAEKIIYNRKKQSIKATSGRKQRVTTKFLTPKKTK